MARKVPERLLLAVWWPLLMAAHCQPVPPTGMCPSPPVSTDQGPVPPMAGQSTVDIQLDRLYVIARVRSMVDKPPSGDTGAFVRNIDLKVLPGSGGQRINAVQIRLEPWIKTEAGPPVSLQRFYDLTLQVTPHLITPSTVPSAARRMQLLCAPTETNCTRTMGVLLTFDLFSLTNISAGRPACTTPDSIDGKVVPVVYADIAGQQPLPLPTDAIVALLSKAAGTGGAGPMVTDVNLSTDGALTVGLQFTGPSHVFDGTTTLLSRYPSNDWVVNVDKNVLAASVRAKVLAGITAMSSSATLTSFTATFTAGEIDASAVAAFPVPGICGTTATVNIGVRSPTQMCRDASGTPAIVAWQAVTDQSPNFCVNVKQFWDGIGVGTISGPPPVWPTLAQVSFPAGDNDTFYGTTLDLDNTFTIAGRSTVMDRAAAAASSPRAPLPAKCPGVP